MDLNARSAVTGNSIVRDTSVSRSVVIWLIMIVDSRVARSCRVVFTIVKNLAIEDIVRVAGELIVTQMIDDGINELFGFQERELERVDLPLWSRSSFPANPVRHKAS